MADSDIKSLATKTVADATDELLLNDVANSNIDKKLPISGIRITASQVTDLTSTATELNYTDGVTSAIQTQLNTKLPLAGGTMTGTLDMGSQILDNVLKLNDDGVHFDELGLINLANAKLISWTNLAGTGVMTMGLNSANIFEISNNTSAPTVKLTTTGNFQGILQSYRNNTVPVNGSSLFTFSMKGNNSTPAEINYARVLSKSRIVTAGAEEGSLEIGVARNGILPSNAIDINVIDDLVNIPNGWKFRIDNPLTTHQSPLFDIYHGATGTRVDIESADKTCFDMRPFVTSTTAGVTPIYRGMSMRIVANAHKTVINHAMGIDWTGGHVGGVQGEAGMVIGDIQSSGSGSSFGMHMVVHTTADPQSAARERGALIDIQRDVAIGSNFSRGCEIASTGTMTAGDAIFIGGTGGWLKGINLVQGNTITTGIDMGNHNLIKASTIGLYNPAATFQYTLTPAAIAADRILNLPLITGTDTLAVLGLVQTFTQRQLITASVTSPTDLLRLENLGTGVDDENFIRLIANTTKANLPTGYIIFEGIIDAGGTKQQYGAFQFISHVSTDGDKRGAFNVLTSDINGVLGPALAVDGNLTTVHYGAVIIPPAFKLYFDNGGNTSIRESAADIITLETGGSDRLSLSTTTMTFSDAINIAFNATTGTKIGTATTQKIGFWNVAPIVQPAHIVDADGTLADITTKFNTLLAQFASIGLHAAV